MAKLIDELVSDPRTLVKFADDSVSDPKPAIKLR
jgi:hypothetical protein